MDKRAWLDKNLRKGFLIFKKGQFPEFTGTSYDPVTFTIINAAYLLKGRIGDFLNVMEPFIDFDENKKEFSINLQTEKINHAFLADKILSGLALFELNPKGTKHIEFLRKLGAEFPANKEIPISGENSIKLKNWKSYLDKNFDVTFSNELMDEHSGIMYEKHTAVFSGLELYTLFANITKKNGFSIHSNGSVISSLYDTFFQFMGFEVIEYFRNVDGDFKFTMIMQKINDKESSFDDFFYMYNEMKRRWPTRYGN